MNDEPIETDPIIAQGADSYYISLISEEIFKEGTFTNGAYKKALKENNE